jgi:transposase-like protein
MDTFSTAHFRDDTAARQYLERLRWPDGPICPRCGVIGHAYPTKRPGVYRCAEKACRADFTVTMNTVMERSHIALHKWLQAFHLMNSSKKGVSAHQLHRTLEITYRSAWFMAHRIREAMRDGGLAPFGGEGAIIEADETYYGRMDTPTKPRAKRSKTANKRPIVSLVQRGGSVRSFHVASADKDTVQTILKQNVDSSSRLYTDESPLYRGARVLDHETVRHSANEYVRGTVHTNTIEGYFSIFKRGMRGIYQHCKEKHLHRYLAEYDFRYNHRTALGYNDPERAALAIKSATGKRLTYR